MTADLLRSLYKMTPREVQMRVLVRRRAPVWVKAGIIFIHIPRAAGTSINQALYGSFIGHPRASEVRRFGSMELRALPQFAVTRNPWERLVSAYRFARRGGGVGGAFEAGVLKPERYRGANFDDFARFVNEWLLEQTPRRLDGIFQPQSLFVTNGHGELLVDHIGRLEQLGATLDFVEATIGRRPVIPKGNQSGEKVDFRQFYTPALVELVGRFYAEDIERFGYSFEA
jgi:hypothetical protein